MVIFGTGVVTGGLLVRHVAPAHDRRPRPANARAGQLTTAGLMRLELLRRMEQDLDLTPEQREPAGKVIKEGQERMKKIMETVEPRRREAYRKTIEDFRALLTPEQRQRFDQLLKQQQHRARDQRKAASPRERRPQSPKPDNLPAETNS
jgi:Spy/CpxP family protein refolding chaperone